MNNSIYYEQSYYSNNQRKQQQHRKARSVYNYDDQDDYRQMDDEEYNPYDGNYGVRYNDDDDDRYDNQDEDYEESPVKQIPSFTHKTKNERLQLSMSSVSSNTVGLKTADQAFQLTAKLVLDYLSPKVDQHATSYYLDLADMMFLDAVIPEGMRPEFVAAVAYRYNSIIRGKNSNLKPIVTECMRLGLGQQDSFLLGGGVRMDDGRILVELPNVQSFQHEKKHSSVSPDVLSVQDVSDKLSTSDQAFQITAQLLVDYLSLKLPPGASSYHIDLGDMAFLDAVVPHGIRPGFVKAVQYRQKFLPDSGNLDPIQHLVMECVRLGLGREDSFLIGGGIKMDDGRVLVLPNGSNIMNTKKTKKKVQQTIQVNVQDTSWLENSGLPSDQIQLIKEAINDINYDPANASTMNTNEQQEETRKEEKIQMHTDRRKRTSYSTGRALPPNSFGGRHQEEIKPMISKRPTTASSVTPSNTFSSNVQSSQRSNTPKKTNNSGSMTSNKPRAMPPKKFTSQPTQPSSNCIHKKEKNIMANTHQRDAISVGMEKEVIGGPPPTAKRDPTDAKAERALQRRMRSMERMQKMRMYEEEIEEPLQSHWRDSLWDYSTYGLHKFLILSIIAPLFALGQIQTRSRLNWLGMPAESDSEVDAIFSRMGLVFSLHTLSNIVMISGAWYSWSIENLVGMEVCIFSLIMINLINAAFTVIVCGNTRCSIRRKDNIPQAFMIEDYFLPIFYLRLVIAHLGRHTVDYSKTECVLFSKTGISESSSEASNYVNPQIQMIENNNGSYYIA